MDAYDAAIIGGGPAGSATALFLRRLGLSVCIIEKKQYPRETLCGEFISNEVTESLIELGLFADFEKLSPNTIDTLHVHTERGQTIEGDLGFTAYGMKRGTFDHFLLSQARNRGAAVIQPAEVDEIVRTGGRYTLRYTEGSGSRTLTAARVVAAYGKQNILDKKLHRTAPGAPSHLNGIKFHIDRSLCPGIDARAIHLFTGSHVYCGVNAVDENKVTVCFLEKRTSGDESPRGQVQHLATENAAFRRCFTEGFGEYCRTVPIYGTGNIYFGKKEAVVNGIFMVGDAAGVIAPLTGDGMGMAFQGARLLAGVLNAERTGELDAASAESLYTSRRNDMFRQRLRIARLFQAILLSPMLRGVGLSAVETVPGLLPFFVSLTRG